MSREDTIDLYLLIAMFRCFNEQLYTLKGKHSKIVKFKFNRLVKVARQYENEIVKVTDDSEAMENIYDQLMELILEVKKGIK